MALNQNHTFEDIDEIKCAIVEKNCNEERVNFLKSLLELNQYKVFVKSVIPAAISQNTGENTIEKFTIGVTDITFNPIKAIFNRELIAPNGKTVTPDFWYQKNTESDDEKWYWK